MTNENKSKSRSKKPAERTPPAAAAVAEETVAVQTEETKKEPPVQKPIIPKDIDLSQHIVVKNGYQGRLVYKSARTHEKFVWPEFGSEQMIELLELRNAKNTWKSYFINNWFMFDEEYAWVIDYLGIKQYYKNALNIEDFDSLFDKNADEIERIVSLLSVGQKKSVGYRARQLVAAEEIDSNKAIAALERALGIELIER